VEADHGGEHRPSLRGRPPDRDRGPGLRRPADGGPPVFVAGWICLAGAVIGIACGLYTGFVTPAVGDELYRYPFTSGEYVAAQVGFAVNHLMLLCRVA
jgi:hypothetical protein